MRGVVFRAFPQFTRGLEGNVNHMYLDIKGLVTTGWGDLIDPIGAALSLPWLHDDNTLASQSEISDEWQSVKNGETSTTLHLSDAGITALVNNKLLENEQTLRGLFPDWDNFPADAQLAILSLAWSYGPHLDQGPAPFPKFIWAANSGDWETAALESHEEDSANPGLRPRNKANFVLLNNAAAVVAQGLDPDVLYYQKDLLGKPYPFADTPLPPFGSGVSPRTTLGTVTSIVGGIGLGYLAYYALKEYVIPVRRRST